MASTEAQKRANKAYRERHKPVQITIQYKTDKKEGLRLKAYLRETGQSANSYLKSLIKADLDSKNVQYVDNVETNQAD